MNLYFAKFLKLLPYFLYDRLRHWYRDKSVRLPTLVERQRAFFQHINLNYPEMLISFLDVGARFGIESSGLGTILELKNLHLVGVEPDIREAERLESINGPGRFSRVYPVAVWSYDGEGQLFVTNHVGCSSVFEPDISILKPYCVSEWFGISRTVPIKLTTLSKLLMPDSQFDIIKVDVQGGEYEVFSGGRSIWEKSIALIFESHLIPIYKGQATFDCLHRMCVENGFRLIQLSTAPSFDGEVIEVNCIYVKQPENMQSRDDLVKRVIIAVATGNFNYVEFLLRNWGEQLLDQRERQSLISVLGIQLQASWTVPPSAKDSSQGRGFGGVAWGIASI